MKTIYKKIISDLNINIGEVNYEIYLGADIYYKKNESGYWDIQIYKRTQGTPLEKYMFVSALITIKRKEDKWYKDETEPLSVIGKQILQELRIDQTEKTEGIICEIIDSLNYSLEVDMILKKQYLTHDDIRELIKYYQQVSIVQSMLFQFLAGISALRHNGGDTTNFHETFVQKKIYNAFQIIDIYEKCIKNQIICKSDVKEIFNLLYPNLYNKIKIMEIISNQDETQNYDVALSFAGEDRPIAKKIADELTKQHYKVFYDEYEQASLWGKDLYAHLNDVYKNRARYCLMIISENYSKKVWTSHERKAAQTKAFLNNKEYILPLRIDETEIDGLNETVGYIDLKQVGIDKAIDLLKQKLNS
ncbi:TIR domain-containing protein [Flavobacterium sp. CF108]|uniref:toll/interleukin-1 receptor domain-containing protein n=1 Tax=Flavobacterium sp. CF108 TaxID=1882758 RepID=UPI00092440AD|nr:TIR domain-containing protein [Flavobacterium sp. CF108]SHH92815.1 TIR domain-containing protein [Flavobacterium sp. CF108]